MGLLEVDCPNPHCRHYRGVDLSWLLNDLQLRVQTIVSKEDKRFPLSDEEVALLLQTEGLDVGRSTVTRIRRELGIPGARRRLISP